jgi:hypothetical protein
MSAPGQRQANRNFSGVTVAPQSCRWRPARQFGATSPECVIRLLEVTLIAIPKVASTWHVYAWTLPSQFGPG